MGLLIISIISVTIAIFVPFEFISFVARCLRGRYAGWGKIIKGKKVTKIED